MSPELERVRQELVLLANFIDGIKGEDQVRNFERLVREDQDKISREDERAKLDSESDQESSALAATLRRAIMSFREALDKQGRL